MYKIKVSQKSASPGSSDMSIPATTLTSATYQPPYAASPWDLQPLPAPVCHTKPSPINQIDYAGLVRLNRGQPTLTFNYSIWLRPLLFAI
jgi:hypothetical protein